MSTSADNRRRRSGFTLLEIMVTVALVGICILPLLEVRESSSQMAYRSGHQLHALAYAERLLEERLLDPDEVKEEIGVIEEDPTYSWVLTLEDYDLSTGRVIEEDEEQQGFSQSSNFSQTSGFTAGAPGDAVLPDEDEVADEDSQHRVRRFKLAVRWPSLSGDAPDELLLEGFLPVAREEDESGVLSGPGGPP
jgi:prepilin-type N-terminal cleavage/methylation domain-containing protein